MNIYDKVYGDIGIARIIENIGGHVDEDSRVRIHALEKVKELADAEIEKIKAAVEAEIAASLLPRPPAQLPAAPVVEAEAGPSADVVNEPEA